ncbi:MAG TPA: tRNA 2-selenouridine(34) synthase MnmH [Saprospiraceae bacterium]|nr:tRNA 2-selenouridine(34) synthase MnmH [Saprospiraceae bacterium]
MNDVVRIDEVLPDIENWLIIDVRSPLEFLAGHIPGAVNIPLFSDEERARVGTLYKQVSPETAMKEGLQIAGSKMNLLLEQAAPFLRNSKKQTLIHCWRGGKRSEAVRWLFSFSGITSVKLEGGYKSFRNSALSFFNLIPNELRILGGFTGSGKTEILNELAARGHQVIDLENLAHHKGSAFGSIGQKEQPSNEQFENNLFKAFLSLDPTKPIWLENESKSIGKVYVPDGLWKRMKDSMLYNIEVDKETRLDRILKDYADPSSGEMLKESFDKIYDRLGGLEHKNAIQALAGGDLRLAASIALRYYDKAYAFQVAHWSKDHILHFQDCRGVSAAADSLLEGKKVFIND